MQWRGGSGSSSGERTTFISIPQTLQRNLALTLRSSPLGGGGGTGDAIIRIAASPSRTTTRKMTMAMTMFRNPPTPAPVSGGGTSAQPLDDGGVGQAAALAHGLQPVSAAG